MAIGRRTCASLPKVHLRPRRPQWTTDNPTHRQWLPSLPCLDLLRVGRRPWSTTHDTSPSRGQLRPPFGLSARSLTGRWGRRKTQLSCNELGPLRCPYTATRRPATETRPCLSILRRRNRKQEFVVRRRSLASSLRSCEWPFDTDSICWPSPISDRSKYGVAIDRRNFSFLAIRC